MYLEQKVLSNAPPSIAAHHPYGTVLMQKGDIDPFDNQLSQMTGSYYREDQFTGR